MPEPVDLTEYARLKNIPEMLRQAGVNYPGLKQAAPPQGMQDLMRAAPVGAQVAGGGLGVLGMLAALLAQGGSSRVGGLPSEPDLAARRAAMDRARKSIP
jgi:hypothetical protein